MLKDITLGQYFPGSTVVHRLDPRTKLLLVVLFIAAVFTASGWVAYGVMIAAACGATALANIKAKTILKGLKPVMFIVIFTAVLNLFYTGGEPIIRFWIIKISWEGIEAAIRMALRIMLLITSTLLMTYTTSPISITDGLERLLNPLKKIRFPFHEMSMMMSSALRCIPTLLEEKGKIMSAQKARGADFETGNIFQKAKALLPLLVPLFVSAFRRADELAVAMESRCYHGGEGRTRMKQLSMAGRDYIALAIGAALLAAVIVLRVFGL